MTPIGRTRWLLMIADEYGWGDHVDDDRAFSMRLSLVWPLFLFTLEEQLKC